MHTYKATVILTNGEALHLDFLHETEALAFAREANALKLSNIKRVEYIGSIPVFQSKEEAMNVFQAFYVVVILDKKTGEISFSYFTKNLGY